MARGDAMNREEIIFWIVIFLLCIGVLVLTLWTIFGG